MLRRSSGLRIDCDHAVVGAGPVGAYMAWQLKKNFPTRSVCLFEAESEAGGRFNETLFEGSRIPNGGMRWREYGNYTMAIYTRLADELNITRDQDIITDFIGSTSFGARGGFVRGSNQGLVQWYNPNMPFRTPIPGCSTQCQLIRALVDRYNENITFVASMGNFRNYIQRLLGDESAEFLRDMERLKSYHDEIADAPFYMDTYLWQARYDSVRSYPDMGMGEFPRRMVARFMEMGGRFFPNTKILTIDEFGGRFSLTSATLSILASKLSISIPQQNYQGLTGNVVDRLRATPEFQSTTPTPAVTVQQVWPERWWEKLSPNDVFRQGQMGSTAGYGNYAHVFTPSTRYAYTRNITRSVYDDDLIKTVFWRNLYATQGIEGVEREAIRFLQGLMPNATIPKPLHTSYFFTPTFHAMQKAGSHARGITNARILQWATTQPLTDIPSCKLVLPTDVFNPKMVGWAMAGWQIVIDWFKNCEGITIDPAIDYCKPYTQPPISRTWCDCRPGVPIPQEGLDYIAANCPRAKRDEVDTFVPEYESKHE